MQTGDPFSIAEEDFRDLMRPDAWTGNARMIGQNDDRALGVEKTDDVVLVSDAAAPMRDVAQISAAEREQLFALGGLAVRKDIRDPAEAIAN
jgi:hypothetical protein